MPRFAYVARTDAGDTKNGVLNAKSEQDAAARVRKKGMAVVKLEEKPGFQLSLGGGIPTADLVVFTRTFVTMLEAGLPIVQGLSILGEQQTNKNFKKILEGVKANVEQGATLADSMSQYPKAFDNLFVNLVEAGEAGGVLDTVLNRLGTFLEKQEKIRKEVKGAMTYPVVALLIAIAAVAIMLVKVIPTFENMFNEMDRELPGPTQMVIDLSHWLQNSMGTLLLSIAAIVVGYKLLMQFERVQYLMDAVKLKLPLFGNLIRKTALTRFTQTLGTLLASGVPIVDSLEICRGVVGNRLIADEIYGVIEGIREGKTFVEPLQGSKYFPPLMVQMVEVGESTGRLDQMLERVAQFYEEEVENAVEALTSMIEPLMMVVLGGIVGSLLIAMYLPIFSMAGG